MIDGCSEEFQNKIRALYKNIKEEAYNHYSIFKNKFKKYLRIKNECLL